MVRTEKQQGCAELLLAWVLWHATYWVSCAVRAWQIREQHALARLPGPCSQLYHASWLYDGLACKLIVSQIDYQQQDLSCAV